METSIGMSQEHVHSPANDPRLEYKIEHNLTFYWVRLEGVTIAWAKFLPANGERPGYDFTRSAAVDLIEALYRGDARDVHDQTAVVQAEAYPDVWTAVRSKVLSATK